MSIKAQVYKSPITEAAERLVAETQPQYYSNLIFSNLSAQVNKCAVSLCGQSPALPVTLITFTGKRVDQENVELFWETSQELNNDYFEVERTLNPARGYETIKKVEGAGSSDTKVRYKTNDPNNHSGDTYYRLKQVDLDGSFAYSSVVAVKGASAPFTVTAFPNPAQSKKIAFKVTGSKISEPLIVTIYDVRGRIIYKNSNTALTSDEQVFHTNLSPVSPGKYIIKVKNSDRYATASFVIVP